MKTVVRGCSSQPRPVLSGVPQGSVLGPLLFVLFINDLPDNLLNVAKLFADDLKIVTDASKPVNASQDIKLLEDWQSLWLLRFNAEKCKVIVNQDKTLENYDGQKVDELVDSLKSEKEKNLKQEMEEIAKEMDGNAKRCFEQAQETGVGAWLTVLPIQSLGYTLNKEEFLDSIRLRYGWQIPNVPSFCVCGSNNSIDHSLTCKTGGQVIFRHNKVRNVNAEFLRQACYDVQVEPGLLPIENNEFRVSGINSDQARLDISARGLWSPFQKSMFDVRIFHPNARSYSSRPMHTLCKLHETQKKRDYGDRVTQREKASFTRTIDLQHSRWYGSRSQ